MVLTQKRTPQFLFGSFGQSPESVEALEFFMRLLMRDGKKTKARTLVIKTWSLVQQQTQLPSDALFTTFREQAAPLFGIRTRRVGGAKIQVPYLLSPKTGFSQAIRWTLQGAHRRKRRNNQKESFEFATRLALEIVESIQGQGFAVKQRKERHAQALANRHYTHYARW